MLASLAPATRSRRSPWTALIGLSILLPATSALAQSPPPDRGRLLYETHCIACHTTQMHWRDKRVVRDWASLLGQVGAWQARAKLGWNEADIRAVAEHLNATIYRLGDAPLRGE